MALQPGGNPMGDRPRLKYPYIVTTDLLYLLEMLGVIEKFESGKLAMNENDRTLFLDSIKVR
jgi:hypothetical protein